jgi:hypothetical protein
MKKRFASCLFILLCLFTAQVLAAGLTPEQVVKTFYGKYLSAGSGHSPITRADALKYLTAEVEKQIIRQNTRGPVNDQGSDLPDDDPGYDYFTKSQDVGDDWATTVKAKKVFQKNKVALVQAEIGNDPSMEATLLVVLVQTSGGWKITKIFNQSRFYE